MTQQPGRPGQPQVAQAADGPRLLAPVVLPADLTPASAAPDAPAAGSSLGRHYRRCYGGGDAQPGGLLPMSAVTVRLETDFMTPIPVGSTVRIKASCLGIADRKIYTVPIEHSPHSGVPTLSGRR